MKVNIYYGGRGMVDDPSIFVLNKLQEVLEELNIQVERYQLFELKNTITTLSQTVADADAVILATTVEWMGMGGFMQTFLDSCWLYADKSKISNVYMFPVVMSKTYGEKEVALALTSSWEIIGGMAMTGLTAYVEDTTEFEFNKQYSQIIEKQAEMIYRTVSQKMIGLPNSNQSIKKNMMKDTMKLTPQESEQLSKYASDDTFVQTQKKDIESLSSLYKELLMDQENGGDDYYLSSFTSHFNQECNYSASYLLIITDKEKQIYIHTASGRVTVEFGNDQSADVVARMNKQIFDQIVDGRMSFHKAFMTGDISVKGNFKVLKMLDELFLFGE